MQSLTSSGRHSRISGVYLVLSSLWPRVKLVFDPQVNSSSWWSVEKDVALVGMSEQENEGNNLYSYLCMQKDNNNKTSTVGLK